MGDGQAYSPQANYTIVSLCIIIILLMYHGYFSAIQTQNYDMSDVSRETLQKLVHAEIQSLMEYKAATVREK